MLCNLEHKHFLIYFPKKKTFLSYIISLATSKSFYERQTIFYFNQEITFESLQDFLISFTEAKHDRRFGQNIFIWFLGMPEHRHRLIVSCTGVPHKSVVIIWNIISMVRTHEDRSTNKLLLVWVEYKFVFAKLKNVYCK